MRTMAERILAMGPEWVMYLMTALMCCGVSDGAGLGALLEVHVNPFFHYLYQVYVEWRSGASKD